jgi:DNA-3-methyladenine glycosylase (3mg)
MGKLDREFYNRDTVLVAKELLGKILVHEINGQKLSAKIVEAEAYMGITDKAAHSYGGRRTSRVEIMYGKPGFSYVFIIYGMHYCFNTVTREEGTPQAVLIRAVEPIDGVDLMAHNRFKKPYNQLAKSQIKNLTNGPGKLCGALLIDKGQNGEDLCGDKLYIEEGDHKKFNIISAKRVGIDYAEEAKDYPWRFYIEDNKYVSVK